VEVCRQGQRVAGVRRFGCRRSTCERRTLRARRWWVRHFRRHGLEVTTEER
jgi:hypothetical protein